MRYMKPAAKRELSALRGAVAQTRAAGGDAHEKAKAALAAFDSKRLAK